jgi:hypothetical protein
MEFQEFAENQEKIYDRLKNTSDIVKFGTKPNVPVLEGGYLIAFKHDSDLCQKLEVFSRRISQIVPAIVYDSSMVHTTISDYGIKEGFNLDKKVLDNLCSCVNGAINMERPKLCYLDWLFNQNSVIVAGLPCKEFFEISKYICSLGNSKGIKLRMPWGTHITVSRFLEEKTPEELSDFFKLIKEAPLIGVSNPRQIEVGYFNYGLNGFYLNTYEKFNLMR